MTRTTATTYVRLVREILQKVFVVLVSVPLCVPRALDIGAFIAAITSVSVVPRW